MDRTDDKLIEFETERVSRHVNRQFVGFLKDPCDSRFQQGYLAALLDLYTEGMGKGAGDDRLGLLRAQLGHDLPSHSPMIVEDER